LFRTFQSISLRHSHIRIVSQFPAAGITFILDKDEESKSSERGMLYSSISSCPQCNWGKYNNSH